VLLGLAIGSFVASGFAGAFSGRFDPVTIVRVGILAEVVGLLIVAMVISASTPWYAIVGGLFVYGFGVGLATAQLTGVVLKDVPVEKSGSGSGTQSTSRQIGSALGIAILGTILFSSLGGQLDAKLANQHVPSAVRSSIVNAVVDSAGSAIAPLEKQSPAAAKDARQAFSAATQDSAFAAAGFLALGFLATLSLRPGRRERAQEPATTSSSAAP